MFSLAEEKARFGFEHPNAGPANNTRFVECKFQLAPNLKEYTAHGFCGTLSARLYGYIYISIAQALHSEGMFCWFLLFIPLTVPLAARRQYPGSASLATREFQPGLA